MNTRLNLCFEKTQKIIGQNFRESLKIVEKVEEYRNYWKPKKVKTILLAESHVHTSAEEVSHLLNSEKIHLSGYPYNFVRFVYCLGYGENALLNQKIYDNSGTWQYWKVFYSCMNQINSNADFSPILMGATLFEERISNKIRLLKRMQKAGIWLLDASIVALYKPGGEKPAAKIRKEVINDCWNLWIREMILEANPDHIIFIGKEVWNILSDKLYQLGGINFFSLYQPQAHLTSEEHIINFQKYFEICS